MKVTVLSRLKITAIKIQKDPQVIKNILYYSNLTENDYKINPDGSIDVFKNLQITKYALAGGKLRVKFHKVDGNLILMKDAQAIISSLEGFPEEVTGLVGISETKKLKTLEGCPQKIGSDLLVGWSNLQSLKGAPEKVNGKFSCASSKITTLEGAPREVGDDFECGWCTKLESLKGAPEKVGGEFDCNSCPKLTSLEGAPKQVGGDFNAKFCKGLRSLKGLPQNIGGKTLVPEIKSEIEKIATSNSYGDYFLTQRNDGFYVEAPKMSDSWKVGKTPEEAIENYARETCSKEEFEDFDGLLWFVNKDLKFGKGKYGKLLNTRIIQLIKDREKKEA